jgi:multidrug efflux pump subunit AcrA (membrane-fusion protein)
MLRPSDTHQIDVHENGWPDLDKLLDETAQLARTIASSDEFHEHMLKRAVQALHALGGAIWIRNSEAEFTTSAVCGLLSNIAADPVACRKHAAAVSDAIDHQSFRCVELPLPDQRCATDDVTLRSLAIAIHTEDELTAVLELVTEESARPSRRAAYENIVSAFAEILADFHRQQRLRELTRGWKDKHEFLLRIHARNDLRATCYVLANELRRVAQCDRVTVLSRRGSSFRVAAVSNLDQFDTRSAVVLAAEQLAAGVDADAGPLWFDEATASEPESLLIRDFVAHSHSRAIGILPLLPRCVMPQHESDSHAESVGLILCERFTARPFEMPLRRELSELSQHAAVAVSRAIALERIPLFRWLSAVAGAGVPSPRGSRIKRALLVATLLAIAVGAAVWPVPFDITASGTLQPANRREIFAPTDGIVQELKVKEGDRVAAGDILVEIRNDEIELEITQLTGELETNRRRLQTIQAARLEAVKPAAERTEPAGRLAAEEEQLKEVIRGLESQYAFRQQQREQLHVRSPIAGEVLTWDLDRLLRARPLRRGQRMMTVADVDDAWTLEMQIADADVGHVLDAVQGDATKLQVSYRTAARPDIDQFGVLDKIADWTEVSDSGRPTVKMIAKIADPNPLDVRPGAMTSAAIHLGNRSRAYVWFRQVIEYVRIHFWL